MASVEEVTAKLDEIAAQSAQTLEVLGKVKGETAGLLEKTSALEGTVVELTQKIAELGQVPQPLLDSLKKVQELTAQVSGSAASIDVLVPDAETPVA